MTSRLVIVFSIFNILLSGNVFCQDKLSKVMLDVDSIPIIRYGEKEILNSDSIFYIKLSGAKIQIDLDIEYEGGLGALHDFCDSVYYKSKKNIPELNAAAYYFILFNHCSQINEIRIYKRFAYNNRNYDDTIKKILYMTNGNWKEKKHSINKFHIYFGRFLLR